MSQEEITLLKDIIFPFISLIIALATVIVAYLSFKRSKDDRAEAREFLKDQENAAKSALHRKQQEEIFSALTGGKESVGFMALQLSRTPEIVSEDNCDSVVSSLCLAYIFNSSSRARALTLNALLTFSEKYSYSQEIKGILKDIKENFSEYDELTVEKELEKYHKRIDSLIAIN